MEVLPLDITEEILVRLKVKDLSQYKIVCKSWNSLISSDCFVKSHLNYTLKQKAKNNEIGDTRIVLTDHNCLIVGSSNGLVCLRFKTELLVVNPSIHQVIKLKRLPQALIKEPFPCMGFGYDSSIDDYKVVIGFRKTCTDKYRFLVLTLKLNVWRSVVGEFNYKILDTCGILCNGAIHWHLDRKNKLVIVSFDLSKEVFKEISSPPPLNEFGTYKLGTTKDRLCFFCGSAVCNLKLWVMKNYNVQESESIWEQMLPPPPCDDCPHRTIYKSQSLYAPPKNTGHIHIYIWMLEEDSSAPVFVQRVNSPHGKAHIWLSTILKCNVKYDEHVFVESLVSPRGMGNDNGNCNEGRVTSKGGKCRRQRRIYK